ncbi:hypothetical protein H1P_210043 [Hyella patelloides LEGE 07179]|uniref:Uncharacterized protein n=1 Tax=Hyella patelloides LEGE 07179 TaxID=945734 RepID=A0A563VQC2_9CYAN|nr:hypothetical protein H1P_210043 [Hyella patelloides LEGE 07179]
MVKCDTEIMIFIKKILRIAYNILPKHQHHEKIAIEIKN